MLELNVLILDGSGIPRAWAAGNVETNSDLDFIKEFALEQWSRYCEKHSHRVDPSNYSMSVKVMEE